MMLFSPDVMVDMICPTGVLVVIRSESPLEIGGMSDTASGMNGSSVTSGFEASSRVAPARCQASFSLGVVCRQIDRGRLGCISADGAHRVRLIEGDRPCHHRGTHTLQVAASSHRADDGGTSPLGELRSQRSDPTEDTMH